MSTVNSGILFGSHSVFLPRYYSKEVCDFRSSHVTKHDHSFSHDMSVNTLAICINQPSASGMLKHVCKLETREPSG